MRVPRFVLHVLRSQLSKLAATEPDEIIGPGIRSRKTKGHVPVPKAFLRRWFVIPKNKYFNIYLHQFLRDDEDRALHDHPWFNLSILLAGQYIEHTIAAGGVHKRMIYQAGDLKFRAPWSAHRVELIKSTIGHHLTGVTMSFMPTKQPSWSLFITGPKQHGWGFHCPGEWTPQEMFAEQGGCSAADEKLKDYTTTTIRERTDA
jgi:hypothetical protein